MSLWEFEQHPIGKALTELRLRGATDFKDPQHQGQRGCDWDAGLMAACEVVRQALPKPGTDGLMEIAIGWQARAQQAEAELSELKSRMFREISQHGRITEGALA